MHSVHTRPEQENSQKNIKKSRKIIKPLADNFFSQNGMRYDEKERKNFSPEFRSYLNEARKFRKKIVKKFKKLKYLFPALFLAKTG